MADVKKYTIQINGLNESIKAVDALNESLKTLESRIKAVLLQSITNAVNADRQRRSGI